jgi:hypothetical protein
MLLFKRTSRFLVDEHASAAGPNAPVGLLVRHSIFALSDLRYRGFYVDTTTTPRTGPAFSVHVDCVVWCGRVGDGRVWAGMIPFLKAILPTSEQLPPTVRYDWGLFHVVRLQVGRANHCSVRPPRLLGYGAPPPVPGAPARGGVRPSVTLVAADSNPHAGCAKCLCKTSNTGKEALAGFVQLHREYSHAQGRTADRPHA